MKLKVHVWRGPISDRWYVDQIDDENFRFSAEGKQFNTFEEARAYLNGDEKGLELYRLQLREDRGGIRSDQAAD